MQHKLDGVNITCSNIENTLVLAPASSSFVVQIQEVTIRPKIVPLSANIHPSIIYQGVLCPIGLAMFVIISLTITVYSVKKMLAEVGIIYQLCS